MKKMNLNSKNVTFLIAIILMLGVSIDALAQFTANDLITVNQNNSKYPGYRVDTYQGQFSGGHPYFWMSNYGGTPTSPTATTAGRILGAVIFGGHDGQSAFQSGRIAVSATSNFSTQNRPTKMRFQLGGTGACCGITRMTIDGSTGNVGIGTDNPGVYKLAVNGTVRAKEVRVETGWADFVFEKGYDLPPLEEVKAHILDKGHLKDIPSASEVEENGIGLGEMNSKLLQKIEELTLYLIAQDEKITILENKINQNKP